MPRKRANPDLAWLPPRVYPTKTAYALHPRSGGSTVIAPITARPSQVWAAYEQLLEEPSRPTMQALMNLYFTSSQFKKLSHYTRTDYQRAAKVLAPVLGAMDPNAVGITHIRQYMDRKGETAPVCANRHLSFLQTVFKWGRERGHRLGDNPCSGVSKFTETPRSRYVTDDEYAIVLQLARKNRRARYLAPFMELAYLCRLRKNEVQTMTTDQIQQGGIYVVRGKGSENEITEWSDRLRAAVSEALALAAATQSELVIHDTRGNPIRLSTFDSAWQRLMQRAKENGLQEGFTFHDIKAKGISDHESHYGGHRSAKMKAVYQRNPKKVKPTK